MERSWLLLSQLQPVVRSLPIVCDFVLNMAAVCTDTRGRSIRLYVWRPPAFTVVCHEHMASFCTASFDMPTHRLQTSLQEARTGTEGLAATSTTRLVTASDGSAPSTNADVHQHQPTHSHQSQPYYLQDPDLRQQLEQLKRKARAQQGHKLKRYDASHVRLPVPPDQEQLQAGANSLLASVQEYMSSQTRRNAPDTPVTGSITLAKTMALQHEQAAAVADTDTPDKKTAVQRASLKSLRGSFETKYDAVVTLLTRQAAAISGAETCDPKSVSSGPSSPADSLHADPVSEVAQVVDKARSTRPTKSASERMPPAQGAVLCSAGPAGQFILKTRQTLCTSKNHSRKDILVALVLCDFILQGWPGADMLVDTQQLWLPNKYRERK